MHLILLIAGGIFTFYVGLFVLSVLAAVIAAIWEAIFE